MSCIPLSPEGVIGRRSSKPVARNVGYRRAFERFPAAHHIHQESDGADPSSGYSATSTLPASGGSQCFCALLRLRACTPAGNPNSRKVDYKFFLNFFQDTQEHRYSFRRFDA